MEDVLKICHIKNLKKVDFNSTLNISVDANANVKTILDINSYLFNIKADCTDGKAIISGKIGVSVLYLDTDNIFNTRFCQSRHFRRNKPALAHNNALIYIFIS